MPLPPFKPLEIDAPRNPAVHGDGDAREEGGARRGEKSDEISQGLGEVDQRRIGGAAHHIRRRRIPRRRAHHVDDAPTALPLHVREHLTRHPNIAQQLEAPAAQPFIVRRREEVAALDGPGIIDQDVEPAEARDRLGRHALDRLQLAQIGGGGEHFGAGFLLDFAGRALERLGLARADHRSRSLARQRARHRAPDALAAPRDQCRLSVEAQIHYGLPSLYSITPRRPLWLPMYQSLPCASTASFRMPTLFDGSWKTRNFSVFGSKRATVSVWISFAQTMPAPSTLTA